MRFLNRYWIPPLGMLLLCQGCVSTSATSASGAAMSGGAAVANLNLGAAYLRQGRLTLALERLDRALDHDPRLAEAHSTIATVYDRLGDVEEARDHHRRALRLAPNDPATANSFGVFLCRHERWSDAEPLFLRAAGNPRYHTPEVAPDQCRDLRPRRRRRRKGGTIPARRAGSEPDLRGRPVQSGGAGLRQQRT